MKAKLVFSNDPMTLMEIKQKLKTTGRYADDPTFEKNFEALLYSKNQKEPIFAIGVSQQDRKHIQVIFSTHIEYKLTRGLSKYVHLEELYLCPHAKQAQINAFEEDLVRELECYKMVAINVEENHIFKPHQRLMTIEHKALL